MTATTDKPKPVPPIRPPERVEANPMVVRPLAGRLPLTLMLSLGLAGAILPLIQNLSAPRPWMAQVRLAVTAPDPSAQKPALDAALRALTGTRALGRAVDILALDRDPEFNGSEAGGLAIVMELLAGQGAGPADARSRAIAALASDIAIERAGDGQGANLLVRASADDKAARIAEALASVFAAATEQTGAIGQAADPSAGRVAAADQALAAFRSETGDERLSTALVLQKRLQGLENHLEQFRQAGGERPDPLASASLEDVLSGRVAGGIADSRIDRLRQAYVAARMEADTLSTSLGPRHPQLLAAKDTADAARKALGQGLSAYRQGASAREQRRKAALGDLETQKAALKQALTATGVDLGRYDALLRAADDAHAEVEQPQAASAASGPIYQASAVEALPQEEGLALPWRIAAGCVSGLGAALAFTLAFRSRRSGPVPVPRPSMPAGGDVPVKATAAVGSVAAAAETPAIAGAVSGLPGPVRTLAPQPTSGPRPQMRAHSAANGHAVSPGAIASGTAPAQAASAARAGMPASIITEAEPTILKLQRVAPHLFAEPVIEEDLAVEQLRKDMAELRARVLRRASGAL